VAESATDARGPLSRAAAQIDLATAITARGVVERAGDGVALVAGLEDVAYEELVQFDSGALGMAYDLGEVGAGVILLGAETSVRAGEGVVGLARLPDLPVGPGTLGRVFDPLGRPLDDGGPLPDEARLPLFRPAPELIERKGVDEPLRTGLLVVDAAIPIGRGQRELVIGDRNVGKTALAIDIVAAQRRGDVACVYVVIAQPVSRVLALQDTLARAGCLDNTAIVAADASATPGLRYLAPYAGASVAEWFRDQGGHALVVYDDLTKHAGAYRELALLLDRPPGREAFPGDIFHIHAELLERAAARRAEAGGGSVTALPLVETTDGDIASYIPTNVISITDGQIFLDTTRFERNQRPAVDVGRSVSRIGGAAQPDAVRRAARNLRVLHARFEELESLTRVGLELDPGVEQEIARGRLLREMLQQGRLCARSAAEQVIALLAVSEGWIDSVALERAREEVDGIVARARAEHPSIMELLEAGTEPEGNWRAELAPLCAAGREAAPRPSEKEPKP
jgi:F-type H+-transporting ATPase subunit alpha